MYKSVIVAAVFCVMPTHLFAQEPNPGQMLTVEQAIRISNGLAQLDCFQPMDGGLAQGCKKRYDIGLPALSIISRNIEKGTSVFQSYRKAMTQRRAALMDEKGVLDPAAQIKLEIEDRATLEAPSGVVMDHLKESDVLTAATPMPGTVLTMIRPILD